LIHPLFVPLVRILWPAMVSAFLFGIVVGVLACRTPWPIPTPRVHVTWEPAQ